MMKILKRSLLLSTSLFCIIHGAGAMEDYPIKENGEQNHLTIRTAPSKLQEKGGLPKEDTQILQRNEAPHFLSSVSAKTHGLEQSEQETSVAQQSITDPNGLSALLPTRRPSSATLEEESKLNPIKRRSHWENQYAPSHTIYSSDPALPEGVKLKGLQTLTREQLPLEDPHSVYFLNDEGTYSNLMQHRQTKPTLGVCIYGPDANGRVNYVTEDLSYGNNSKK